MLTRRVKRKIITFTLLSISFLSIKGHGFSATTKVKKENSSWQIGQIYRNPQNKVIWVSSYDPKSHQEIRSDIKRTGKSITNCYFRIYLDNTSSHAITCTPSQEFYCAKTQQWTPAYQLRKGDTLVGATEKCTITSLDFIKKPLCVYAFEVKNTHTYFVGNYAILTHNMFLPMAIGSLGVSFGSGAATGAAAGSFWGPITCAGGVILGGAIGIIAKACSGLNKVNYKLDFDVAKIDRHLINTKNVDNDETDAQAPGKPTEKDGFVPKKNWDGKKVKHPKTGQCGWPDKKGHIWAPTGPGPKAHGGPHWDVVAPNGTDYDNIYPGGTIRKGKK